MCDIWGVLKQPLSDSCILFCQRKQKNDDHVDDVEWIDGDFYGNGMDRMGMDKMRYANDEIIE